MKVLFVVFVCTEGFPQGFEGNPGPLVPEIRQGGEEPFQMNGGRLGLHQSPFVIFIIIIFFFFGHWYVKANSCGFNVLFTEGRGKALMQKGMYRLNGCRFPLSFKMFFFFLMHLIVPI